MPWACDWEPETHGWIPWRAFMFTHRWLTSVHNPQRPWGQFKGENFSYQNTLNTTPTENGIKITHRGQEELPNVVTSEVEIINFSKYLKIIANRSTVKGGQQSKEDWSIKASTRRGLWDGGNRWWGLKSTLTRNTEHAEDTVHLKLI